MSTARPPEPRKMYVTTDVVAFSMSKEHQLRVLLIKRANPPYKGKWSLPGGFVEEEEDLPAACARELLEETGVRATALLQLGAWGKPGRDPRGRNVTVAYVTALRPAETDVQAGSDAELARWHPMDYLPPLGFDHKSIVQAGFRRLRSLVGGTHFVYRLLPETFTVDQLCEAMTVIRGELMTEQEGLAFLKRCRVVRETSSMARQDELYRCATTFYVGRLR